MPIFILITGFLLLLAGRRLFWVSVACVGFIVAYRYTLEAGIPGPSWITWVVPLGIGLIGALIAIVYQKLAVILVGFLIGGFIVADMVSLIGIQGGNFSWVILLAGCLTGAIAMLVVFDWALIVMSSLAGAFVIIPSMGLSNTGSDVVFVVLAVLGIVVQTVFFLKLRKRSNSG